ncbi:hypothetical protein Tco_0065355 [Tanacetum coccineum]
MPPGIESDDYDSEGDFRFLKELLINDSSPLPENESYNLDGFDNPESPVVKSCFDFEPVAAVTNDFDVLNNDESFDSGEGENVDSLNVEEEDSFTFIFDRQSNSGASIACTRLTKTKPLFSIWKLHGSKLGKDKAVPTFLDGLQSSLHKWENSYLYPCSLSN